MGKQQTIKIVQQQLLKPDTYLFRIHQQTLSKEGVARDHQIIKTLDILQSQTWRSCLDKKLKIPGKYQKKLKVMSILTAFHGCTEYSLPKLQRQIDTKREETLNLLVQANIHKLISIQIDEQTGKIKIVKAKIRERELTGEEVSKYMKGKIIQIKDNNTQLQREMGNILGLIGGETKKSPSSPEGKVRFGL